ncbi:hypothetical protein ACOSP6_08845 [Tenacibaculum sp. MEBiC06402]|uniref:hypothetical protein n=1 Tax=unclassified Tenacibaculum TaxID=2635139 RepID=UPI003B9B02E6
MKKENLYQKLLFLKEEILQRNLNHYLVRFKNEHLEEFANNLCSFDGDEEFLNKFNLPFFDEEFKIDRSESFKEFLFLFNEEQSENALRIQKTKMEDFLIVLGQRLTSASVRNEKAIPPLDNDLFIASFQLYNSQISKAVRAFEKHSERFEKNFWGKVKGNPKQKEGKVREILKFVFEHKTWWNVYYHFQHELVYEIRVASGHGVRWKMSNLDFIGFVEPFLNSENI